MDTIETLFSALGGPSAVGRIIGKSTEHAASMRRRRSIPVRYWPMLIHAAPAKGVPLDTDKLLSLHKSNSPSEPSAPTDAPDALPAPVQGAAA